MPEARESRSSEQRNENLDRHPVVSIARFNPSNVYIPKAGKWLLLHDLSELLFLVLLKNQGPFFHQIVEINPVFLLTNASNSSSGISHFSNLYLVKSKQFSNEYITTQCKVLCFYGISAGMSKARNLI